MIADSDVCWLHHHVVSDDAVDHSNLAGLTHGIFVDSKVFLGKGIDAGVCTLFGGFHCSPYNDDVVLVFGVHDGYGHLGILPEVSIFGATLCRIEDEIVTIQIYPHGCQLGAAVRIDCGNVGENRPLDKKACLVG
jgi:hypothetical protein